jgi:CBS domain-containing protein
MQSRAEHTGLSVEHGGEQGRAAGRADSSTVGRGGSAGSGRDGEFRVFPFANHDAEAPRVADMPMRQIPVIPAHLPMAGARKIAALKRIGVLLVERDAQIVGTVDESVLGAADDRTPTASAMKPLGLYLRPAMSVAEARDVFVRARATILPVIAGGFVLGAVARSDIERTKPRASEK